MSIPDYRINLNGISVGHPSVFAAAGFEQKKKGLARALVPDGGDCLEGFFGQ